MMVYHVSDLNRYCEEKWTFVLIFGCYRLVFWIDLDTTLLVLFQQAIKSWKTEGTYLGHVPVIYSRPMITPGRRRLAAAPIIELKVEKISYSESKGKVCGHFGSYARR